MRRISIRSLMGFVVVSAIGLAALRGANELWAAVMLTIAFGAVAAAVLGALIFRERPRYGWAGFAVFSGGYLILAVGPGLSDAFRPHLATTYLLTYVQEQVAASSNALAKGEAERALLAKLIAIRIPNSPDHVSLTKRLAALDTEIEKERASQTNGGRWRSLLPGAVDQDEFLCVGHSLFALLAGFLGGTIARWFYAKRDGAESTAESPPVN